MINCRKSNCNGVDISCHECQKWPQAQKDGLRWALKYKEERKKRKSQSSHPSDKSKSATADIRPIKESNLHQMLPKTSSTTSKPDHHKLDTPTTVLNRGRPELVDDSRGTDTPNSGPITSAVTSAGMQDDILKNPLLSLNPNLSKDQDLDMNIKRYSSWWYKPKSRSTIHNDRP